MQKVLICEQICGENSHNKIYYKCSETELCIIDHAKFIYKFTSEITRRNVIILKVLDFVDEDDLKTTSIELLEDASFIPISQDYIYSIKIDVLNETKTFTVRELKKIFNDMLQTLKITVLEARYSEISDERKSYLFETFGVEGKNTFDERTKDSKMKWFGTFNEYDIDFQYIINLYNLQEFVKKMVDDNIHICNIDKIALKAKFLNKIESIMDSINPRGNARFQMNSYIGVETSATTKELIWGHMSPCEIKIEFSYFWNIVKNLLSLSYIPAIILLLDSDKKIIIYIFLGIVYLLTLVFSDEKQMDKLLFRFNAGNSRRIDYDDFYYVGMITSVTFIIYSIQLIIDTSSSNSITNIVMYLCADILISYIFLIFMNLIITLIAWVATLYISTHIYKTKSSKITKWIYKVARTIFWIASSISLYHLLNIARYLKTQSSIKIQCDLYIFCFGVLLAFMKIFTIWKKRAT